MIFCNDNDIVTPFDSSFKLLEGQTGWFADTPKELKESIMVEEKDEHWGTYQGIDYDNNDLMLFENLKGELVTGCFFYPYNLEEKPNPTLEELEGIKGEPIVDVKSPFYNRTTVDSIIMNVDKVLKRFGFYTIRGSVLLNLVSSSKNKNN